MSITTDLQDARKNMAANLKLITATPKPSYNVAGVSYSWKEYGDFLIKGIADIDGLISQEDGPWDVLVQGET